ncbi:50S ribosomal protein L15 [Candidatus Parcubacteria bacterium]|nr:50S ribosomal protein L15 [Candidatus Parcubacteria bacterium]
MQSHELQRKTPNSGSKRIGRGRGSGKGKTSGRGTKGQKARAGHKIWPNIREILKKIPKRRGYNAPGFQPKPSVVNLATLEKFFSAGDTVNPSVLKERGIMRSRKGEMPVVKVLGDGELTKKLTFSGVIVSASAKTKIEKAGGTIAK